MFLDGGKNMPPVLRSPDEVGAKEEGAWALGRGGTAKTSGL